MKFLFSPSRTTSLRGAATLTEVWKSGSYALGPNRRPDCNTTSDLAPDARRTHVAAGAMACPPFGTHNAALVGVGGLRSKSLQELFGHVGGPVLRIDAEPEGEVGAEDHC